jgi:hypothetical protein
MGIAIGRTDIRTTTMIIREKFSFTNGMFPKK